MTPGDFLRMLGAALRAFSLYPPGHPVREEKIEQVLAGAHQLFGFGHRSLDYMIHEDSFFFENRLLSKESITLQWMIRESQARGIESVSIDPNITKEDLASLLAHIRGSDAPPTGGARVNATRLVDPSLLETPAETDALRNLYARAVGLTREVGMGLASGALPPLGAARDTVEGLVDTILRDPGSALLLATMHSHDEYTFFHMVNVCILSVATGSAIGLDRAQLTVLGIGGLLHDVGKVGVPPEVLNRSGSLSDQDWYHIRRHPIDGAHLLLRSWDRISPLAAVIAYEHHQHLDGTGYPNAPIHQAPDVLSRIVAVADTFDAMTTRRAYRRAEQRQRALDVLISGAGSHYDPRVVRVFIRLLGVFPPGSVVELDDGSIAVVIRPNSDTPDMPVVKIVRDPSGAPIEPAYFDIADANLQGVPRSIVRGLDSEAAGVDPADLL